MGEVCAAEPTGTPSLACYKHLVTDPERLAVVEAELEALRAAFVGFASLFRTQCERAEQVLREAAETVLTSDQVDVADVRAVAQASIRVADQLAEHCAYLDSLDHEGRGIR